MKEFIYQTDSQVLLGFILLMVLIAVIFYIKYDVLRLRRLARDLRDLSAKEDVLPFDQKSRMEQLVKWVTVIDNPTLITAWEDFYREYSIVMRGKHVPDIRAYINEKRLIDVPCARKLMEQLWQALFVLGAAGSLLYLALTLGGVRGVQTEADLVQSLGFSLLSLAGISFIIFLFRLADASSLEKGRRGLWSFQYKAAEWLNPITEQTMINVLVDSQKQSARSFHEAVERLEHRLDRFETEKMAPLLGRMFAEAIEKNITPVLKESVGVLTGLSTAVVEKQAEGMQELAQTFTESVTAVTAERLNGFVGAAQEVREALTGVVYRMEAIQVSMDQTRAAQDTISAEARISLAEAARVQTEVSEALKASLASVSTAEGIAAEMRDTALRGLEKADAMALQSLHVLENNITQVAGLQQGVNDLAQNLRQSMEDSIGRVSGELAKAVTEYAGLSAEMEASRAKHSGELDARIDTLVDALDSRLIAHTEASAQQVAQLMEDNRAQSEGLHSGIRVMAEALERNMETTVAKVSDELTRAVAGYADLSTTIEAARVKQGEELDTRIETLVGALDSRLTSYTEAAAQQVAQLMAENRTQSEGLHSGIQVMAEALERNMETTVAKVSDELTKAVAGYADLSTAMEVTRVKQGVELDTRIDTLVGALDSRLTSHTEAAARQVAQLMEENRVQAEGLHKGIRVMAETLEQNMLSTVAQVSEELNKAVTGYAVLNTEMETARSKHSEELDTRINMLVSGLDGRLAEYSDQLALNARENAGKIEAALQESLGTYTQTAEKLAVVAADVALEGSRIFEKINTQANELYNGLAGRMDRSIDALGENMAAGMKTAMADSMELVEQLTIRTQEMKELYDSYFTRVEEQSVKTLDELDFNVQKMFAAFSSETTQIISRLTDNSSNALEFFDKGIKDLVENMDEHSRSIGLYAKEINLDVADLSNNLRSSVQEFSTQMETGIVRTFEDFDKGLGEVTLRLADILDSIRDSAEALQKALKR